LVRDIFSGPSEASQEDVSHLVEGQVDDPHSNVAALVRIPQRPCLCDLSFTFVVEPLNQDGRVDEEGARQWSFLS